MAQIHSIAPCSSQGFQAFSSQQDAAAMKAREHNNKSMLYMKIQILIRLSTFEMTRCSRLEEIAPTFYLTSLKAFVELLCKSDIPISHKAKKIFLIFLV